MTAELGTLVTLTAYWLPDREPADRTTEDRDLEIYSHIRYLVIPPLTW
jgi:hypothetical protein